MAYIGYPIVNDPLYNNKNATSFGQFLHSKTITFIHPITKKEMHFESDLPKEFQDFLDKIEEN
jgi:23S rRNA pseudouridine1911/1915/1917 synthase